MQGGIEAREKPKGIQALSWVSAAVSYSSAATHMVISAKFARQLNHPKPLKTAGRWQWVSEAWMWQVGEPSVRSQETQIVLQPLPPLQTFYKTICLQNDLTPNLY